MIDKTPRYLITTADERTWKFDKPVLFLGEWCRKYDRRHVWQTMNAIVAKPYGLTKEQKDIDQSRARVIENELIVLITNELNAYHGTKHSVRYWQILVGQWLRVYIEVISNRYNTLKQCFDLYNVEEIPLLNPVNYKLGTIDFLSFIYASNDDIWDSVLTSRILNYMTRTANRIDNIEIENVNSFKLNNSKVDEGKIKRKQLKYFLEKNIVYLGKKLSRDQDAVIITSYLPIIEELKLQISFGQFPIIWRTPAIEQIEANISIRRELSKHFSNKKEKGLLACLKDLIYEMIPACYLEGYKNLCKKANEFGFPQKPRFIFTSNNFYTDEIFKCWAAEKVENHVPYIVGQHGNNYGTNRFISCDTIEEITSDKFLTWGWTEELPQHTPAFNFKIVGMKQGKYNPKGNLLLIEDLVYNRVYLWDKYSEFCDYFNEQLEFIQNLDLKCKEQLVIRLHRVASQLQWFDLARWQDFDSNLKVDIGRLHIQKLIQNSRLVVHSYDSTGILETLSLNIPTMAFWQYGLTHVRENALPYYEALVEAGIFHLSPESIANKVNSIWDNVEEWWESRQVQEARLKFCRQYARQSEKPITDLKKILLHSVKAGVTLRNVNN